MRRLVDAGRLRTLMAALGDATRGDARVYLTGGASAVLIGWRLSTIDVDAHIEPERDEVLRAIGPLKEKLDINIELASPGDFIPELPAWRERSPFIAREGRLDFFHYDFYAQALSKIERGHTRDLDDVLQMNERGLVDPDRLAALAEAIDPQLYRFPAIDPPTFRSAVAAMIERMRTGAD